MSTENTEAIAHFAGRLRFETDVSDVHADYENGTPDVILIDTRNDVSWQQGHIPHAIHLPTAQIASHASKVIPAGSRVVTYCWGPGCNGATKAALEFARLGYPVKEMLGGFEYWVREGFPVRDEHGLNSRPADSLTAPTAATCGC